MPVKKMIYLTLAAALVVVVYFGWKLTSRSAYETAEYAVLESDQSFEVREYPDLMMATTDMQQQSQGNDGSFMRLFGYISGANEPTDIILAGDDGASSVDDDNWTLRSP